jgi:hypothetical protein
MWAATMGGSNSMKTNVHRWLARATMDAIGEGKVEDKIRRIMKSLMCVSAAFDYQFGAMDNSENKLGKTYQDML